MKNFELPKLLSDHPPVFPIKRKSISEGQGSQTDLHECDLNTKQLRKHILKYQTFGNKNDSPNASNQKKTHHLILPIPKRAVLFPLRVAFYGLCHFLFRTEVTHMLLPHRPLILLPVASIRRIFWDPNNTPHSRFSTKMRKFIKRWRGLTWCHERRKLESKRCILYVPMCLSTHIVPVVFC